MHQQPSLGPQSPTGFDERLPLARLLWCAAGVVVLSMGIRHGFGLWMQPMVTANGWTRETFSLAMALQNLFWGLAGPVAGALADRWGAQRVLMVGAALYAAGLATMALASTGVTLILSAGLLIGMAQAGSTYAVVYGAIGRHAPPERRTWAMGVAAAAGSFGQFLMVPLENYLIEQWGWQGALWCLALLVLLIVPLSFGLKERPIASVGQGGPAQGANLSAMQALAMALRHPSYLWTSAGYFVCGFQVVFVAMHLPSALKDAGLSPSVATTALALIGLFNIAGTYAAGHLAQHGSKRLILSTIYALRALVILIFMMSPWTPMVVWIFAACMGLLWLSTVPVTNALIAHMLGVRHLGLFSGVTFLSHQLGSFLGVWLGGRIYDITGNYTFMWWTTVVLGLLAALIYLPVQEKPLKSLTDPGGQCV